MRESTEKDLIKKIIDVDGVLCTQQAGMKRAFLTYYQTLFQSKRLEEVDSCLSGMTQRIRREMNEQLPKPCTPEEVREAIQRNTWGLSKPQGL
jgi:hypothetical protein